MKLFAVILLLIPIYASAEVTVVDGKITADIYSQTLGEVIQKLEKQGNLQFSVEDGIKNQTVSASFKDLPIAIAIKKLLEGTGINYAVVSVGEDPPVIFIGKREAPGATRRVLDARPVNRPQRGVVTPVPPSYSPPPPADGTIPLEKQGVNPLSPVNPKPANPNSPVSVPTGGGYIPGSTQQPDQPPNEENQTPEEESDTEEQ